MRVIGNATVSKASGAGDVSLSLPCYLGEVLVIWNATVSKGSVCYLEHHSKGSAGYLDQMVYPQRV
jgi:hypothetical protein